MSKLTVKKIINDLELIIENPQFAELDRLVTITGVHRLGLELAGVYETSHSDNQIIGWGTKESKWLSSLSTEKSEEALRRVLTNKNPLIILSSGVTGKIKSQIIKIANEFGIPVSCVTYHLSYVMSSINWYLAKILAPSIDVHGSLVVVYGIGVMIVGPSGIGKSEAVLELIQDGHQFISDDTVTIAQIGTDFYARAAAITKGYLEARGIGLIDVQHMYGAQTVKDDTSLQLVIELVPGSQMNELDRLGNQNLRYKIFDADVQLIQIPVDQGRNVATLIKAATSAFISKKHGYDALSIIQERFRNQEGDEEDGN